MPLIDECDIAHGTGEYCSVRASYLPALRLSSGLALLNLAHEFEVAGLLENRSRRIVSESAWPDLPGQARLHPQPVQDVQGVIAGQRPTLAVAEQEVLGLPAPALPQPRPEMLGCLRAEESQAVLLALASAHTQIAGGEVHLLDAQAEGFADAETAVGEQGDQRPVPPTLECLGVASQKQASDMLIFRPLGRVFGTFMLIPRRGFSGSTPASTLPTEERAELAEVQVRCAGLHTGAQGAEIRLHRQRRARPDLITQGGHQWPEYSPVERDGAAGTPTYGAREQERFHHIAEVGERTPCRGTLGGCCGC